ncbi:MAG TPA: TetR/AcrR family transcriptional regulator [Baekduia sp.]|uniref:TetR/AcrR family transcriptional regulator n=1 Tax=Baekduia sp. TaxID=2600305 RepID=UPI002D787D4A|nr:TetR/AcrR family transcriptional regulator [Baekduia sp.]HET6506994.1 TetR/AcrR family transcriptional regulator [Baekduia sp.]
MLDAAARVFYERGYADASVQDVADELGILKGSLYHYIKTKEDLLFRLLEETHDEIFQVLGEVAAIEGLDPLARLELYVRRQVEYNIDNLLRVSVYYHDLDRLSVERRKRIVSRRREHEQYVRALIEEAQANGQADPDVDATTLGRCIFATIIWTYRWYREGRDDREQVAAVCSKFAIRGIVGDVARKPARGGKAPARAKAAPKAKAATATAAKAKAKPKAPARGRATKAA